MITWLDKIMDVLSVGLLATIGGVANYVNAVYVKNEKAFSLLAFCVNVVLAFFVGNLVGEFIEPANKYRDGLIMVAGYCTFPILGHLETAVLSVIDILLKKGSK